MDLKINMSRLLSFHLKIVRLQFSSQSCQWLFWSPCSSNLSSDVSFDTTAGWHLASRASSSCVTEAPGSHLLLSVTMTTIWSRSASFLACSVQSLSHVWLFTIPWTAACQTSLSNTNTWSLLKPMSIKLVMPSNHLILCHPLLLSPSILPSIRVFSNESVLCIRWPKYWSFSFIISPSNEYSGLISFRMDWLDLLALQGTLKSLLACIILQLLY